MSSLKMPGCDREMRIRNDSPTFILTWSMVYVQLGGAVIFRNWLSGAIGALALLWARRLAVRPTLYVNYGRAQLDLALPWLAFWRRRGSFAALDAEEPMRSVHPCEVGLVVAVGPARPTRQVPLAFALYDGLGGRQVVGMAALGFDEAALHRLAVVLGVPLLRITVSLGDGESKRSAKAMQERLDDLGETATRLRLPLGQPA